MSALCQNPSFEAAKPLDCSFYTNCLESTYNCGPSGYPVGYGLKYCSRFVENDSLFSEDGQKWINGTLLCLKTALIPLAENTTDQTCKSVESFAFESHVDCYVSNGFCDLIYNFGNPMAESKFAWALM